MAKGALANALEAYDKVVLDSMATEKRLLEQVADLRTKLSNAEGELKRLKADGWYLVSSDRPRLHNGKPYIREGEANGSGNCASWYESACFWRERSEAAESLSASLAAAIKAECNAKCDAIDMMHELSAQVEVMREALQVAGKAGDGDYAFSYVRKVALDALSTPPSKALRMWEAKAGAKALRELAAKTSIYSRVTIDAVHTALRNWLCDEAAALEATEETTT